MNKYISIILCLIIPNLGYSENFCFSIPNSKRILMVSADRSYLFYYPLNNKINLKLKSTKVFDDGGESRSITFYESYYEIINGNKTGIYTFLTQSGRIEDANYLNLSSKKEMVFERIYGVDSKDQNIISKCY